MGIQAGAVSGEKDKTAVLTEVSLILAAVFWGLNFAATKYASHFFPQLLIVAFRFNAGGSCSSAFSRSSNPIVH